MFLLFKSRFVGKVFKNLRLYNTKLLRSNYWSTYFIPPSVSEKVKIFVNFQNLNYRLGFNIFFK